MRAATVALLAGILAGVIWIGGELHRENCQDAGRTSCSILPWNAGDAPAARPATGDITLGR